MHTKLTLSVEAEVIEKAKEYARKQRTSLSFLVENYLKLISSENKQSKEIEISPLVKRLSGAAKNLPDDFDYKEELTKILTEKYK